MTLSGPIGPTTPHSGLPVKAPHQPMTLHPPTKTTTSPLAILEEKVLDISAELQDERSVQTSLLEIVRRLQAGGGLEEFFTLVVPAVDAIREANEGLQKQLKLENKALGKTLRQLTGVFQRLHQEEDYEEFELAHLESMFWDTQEALFAASLEHQKIGKMYPGWQERLERLRSLESEAETFKRNEGESANVERSEPVIVTTEKSEKRLFRKASRSGSFCRSRPSSSMGLSKKELALSNGRPQKSQPKKPLPWDSYNLSPMELVPEPGASGWILKRLSEKLEAFKNQG